VTTTTLSSSANPSVIGQPVTYTATISQASGGGTVGFTDNGTPITGCTAVPVSGSTATCQATPAAAANTIAATFTGSVGFTGSTSTLTQLAILPPCVGLCKG
jgi:Bacterial Ig-like domain (group 3)